MKKYLKILTSDLKNMSKTNIVLNTINIILIFGLILLKFSILSEFITILDDGTKKFGTGLLIIIAFVLVHNFLFQVFNILIKKIINTTFWMIPQIRKYALIKSGIGIILLFILLLLTIPFNGKVKLNHIILGYLSFVNLYMSLFLSPRILLYKTSKLLILKSLIGFSFFFVILSFAVFDTYPILALIIQVGFVLTFFYQIKYLIYNYLHLVSPEVSSKNEIKLFRFFYEFFVFKSYNSLKLKYTKRPTKSDCSSLFKLFIFGNHRHYIPMILMGLFLAWVYIEFMLGEDRSGVIVVVMVYLFLIVSMVPKQLKQPFKINHLYMISGLQRSDFEKSILIASYKSLIILNSYLFISTLVGVLIYNKFYQPLSLLPLILVVSFLIIIQIISIYLTWYRNFRKKEYGMIKPAKPFVPLFMQKQGTLK